MHKVIEVVQKIRTKAKSPIFADIEKYLETGDVKTLAKITTSGNWSYYDGWHTWDDALMSALSLEDPKDEIQHRLLDILTKCGYWGSWIVPMSAAFEKEKASENFFSFLLASFRKVKKSEIDLANNFWSSRIEPTNAEGKPNSGARYYLAMSDAELKALLKSMSHDNEIRKLAPFLLQFAPDRLDAILEELLYMDINLLLPQHKIQRYSYTDEYFLIDSAKIILEKTGKKFSKRIFKVWSDIKTLRLKHRTGFELIAIDSDLYREPNRQVVLKTITEGGFDEWPNFVSEYGLDHLDEICAFMRASWKNLYYQCQLISQTLDIAIKKFGLKAKPLIDAAASNESSSIRLTALEALVKLDERQFDDLTQERFTKELASGNETLKFLLLAKRWKPQRLVESLWKLLGNKSKPVREAAARALGEIDKIDLDRVEKLLVDKKSDNRDSAVNILAQLKIDAAIKLLEKRLDDEENDDIRDKMLTALESAWEAKGKKITMKTIQERIERASAKVDKFDVPWLDWKKLPELHAEKKKLDEKTVRYFLYRQSRCKEMRADIEAKPLIAMIDRKTSGDFALFVLNSFLASKKIDAADRWALALAGLLGDDRIVPILSKQIQLWADSARGKMSEYAVQTLALLGTETALTVVNSMTIRYRTKYKNIGTAAGTAFEQVAEERGISPDELGDRVVPTLGFEPGKPKVWTVGGKDFEVRIGMDFKVSLFDTEKKKDVASLPKTAPKEIVEELKEIKDALKEVVKGQLLRIENMLVRQYRWPTDRWTELYQRHPVLRPFTVRLVWGLYDDKGKLKSTFRAMEDGSLTDADDETVTLPKSGKIGIVHPLELSEKERNGWRQHLLDFEIVQPFPQLERSVIVPTDDEKPQIVSKKWFGTQLNAMTFKGRAEKLGWRRGSVCDAGWIPMYWKPFPEAGADAFLGLDNFYIGISMDEQVTLQNLCFVKSNSVQIGSYIYDDPDPDKADPRIILFGKVPPIVFSEVMGDMQKIAPDQKES